jgi:hypothetical protein
MWSTAIDDVLFGLGHSQLLPVAPETGILPVSATAVAGTVIAAPGVGHGWASAAQQLHSASSTYISGTPATCTANSARLRVSARG